MAERTNKRSGGLEVGELDALARLSGVDLGPDERAEFSRHISDIIDHIDRLPGIDTAGSEAETAGRAGPPLRADEPLGSPLAGALLDRAPRSLEGFFVVPARRREK